jgi:hypothetical protein
LSADDLVPVAGGREDGTPGITTPLEGRMAFVEVDPNQVTFNTSSQFTARKERVSS